MNVHAVWDPVSSAGWHTLGPAAFGDDHHRAHRRPAGRLPPQQEHPVHHHRQENHELWRWEARGQRSVSTPLPARTQGVTFTAAAPQRSPAFPSMLGHQIGPSIPPPALRLGVKSSRSILSHELIVGLHRFDICRYVIKLGWAVVMNSICTLLTSVCVCVCVRIWHGGHFAAGGWIFPQQRRGHLLPGAGGGLQWICYIRFLDTQTFLSCFFSICSFMYGDF